MQFASKNLNLNLNLTISDIDIVNHCRSYTKTQRYARSFLENNLLPSNTYEVTNSVDIVKLLPDSILEQEIPSILYIEIPSEFDGIAMLPPHVDIKRNAAINYYFETNDEKTSFYNYDKQTQKILEIESFVSKNNETWILDVSAPHSVTFFRPFVRKFLSFSFSKITYSSLATLLC